MYPVINPCPCVICQALSQPEMIRTDVQDATIDAVGMYFADWVNLKRYGVLADSEIPIEFSDSVNLPPLELRF